MSGGKHTIPSHGSFKRLPPSLSDPPPPCTNACSSQNLSVARWSSLPGERFSRIKPQADFKGCALLLCKQTLGGIINSFVMLESFAWKWWNYLHDTATDVLFFQSNMVTLQLSYSTLFMTDILIQRPFTAIPFQNDIINQQGMTVFCKSIRTAAIPL